MAVMTNAPKIMLNCLPWPRDVSTSGDSAVEPAFSAPTVVEVVGAEISSIQALARQLLDPYRLGRVRLDVHQSEETEVPPSTMDESYVLEVTDIGVRLTAPAKWGAVRGLATLAQLARQNQIQPGLVIDDGPRFSWRGLLLDVARHFFPIQSLMSVVDGLAMLKMNVLHLHLSDDQGFRFPSKGYPKLVSPDHYSLEELAALVAYAGARGVRIVPELDMPGHVTSWLVAYPQWGSEACEPSQRFGVHKGCLNPLNDAVYQGIETLLEELAEVFPDDYVHVGGDEVSPDWWQRDATIAAYLQQQAMDTHDLQNEFLVRVCAMVRAQGKIPVAWDEVLHSDMPDCVVQNWRGATTRDRGLAKDLPVLVSAPYYLDLHYPADVHYGFDPELSQAQWLDLEDSLQRDPRLTHVADGIEWTKQWRQQAIDFDGEISVMGGEACLWSELVTPEVLPTRLWSRLPAVAERLWSPENCTDVADMYARLQACWLSLPEDPELLARQGLSAMGFEPAEVEVICLLEPVKWYGRLLGQQALQARIQGSEMPQARPYVLVTPLTRVVDRLLPESMAARRLDELDLAASARRVQAMLEKIEARPLLAELMPAVNALAHGAMALVAMDEGGLTRQQVLERLQTLDKPYGEYMVAPLVRWRWALTEEPADEDPEAKDA